VCAEMLELGVRAKKLHQEVGKCAALSNVDAVFSLGRLAKNISQTAKIKNKRIKASHCKTVGELNKKLIRFIKPGDAVLIKGSRSTHMERTVNFLVEQTKKRR